jgi:hypothetical protein
MWNITTVATTQQGCAIHPLDLTKSVLSTSLSTFACARLSCRLCGGGHNMLDKVILLIQCHVADVMMEVALSADVASLAAAVAGLHDGFEGLSTVDIHRNARRKCTRRGMHCCRDRGGGGM